MKGKCRPDHAPNKAATIDQSKSNAPLSTQSKTLDDCGLMRTIGDYPKKAAASLFGNRLPPAKALILERFLECHLDLRESPVGNKTHVERSCTRSAGIDGQMSAYENQR